MRYETTDESRKMAREAFPGHYKVAGWGDGIAFYAYAYPVTYDEDYEWTGLETVDTSMVLMVMVGDDAEHLTDPDDLTLIPEDGFCRECGQIGCGHNVYA